LGIYTNEVLRSYSGKNLLEMTPHVYAIAEGSYHHMNSYKENQCIIISGESGAGKTEAAKRIMQYIATMAGGASSSIQEIKDMVMATNPLLESFGCAKTLRNNNSSRHGKYLEIQFNEQGEPVGAVITNYLLEKNRVVGQIENERNFHIFYQLTKGAPPEYQEQFGLQGPESYLYTSRSGCLDVAGINDVSDFGETINAMNVIGMPKSEQDEIFKMLAIILWLGNVQFAEGDDGNAVIADQDVTKFIAYLMDVDADLLNKALVTRVMETQRGGRRGSIYDVPLNIVQATAVRDALAKAIYNNLFEWIVARVNQALVQRGASKYVVGVLDIYGFEIFDENSFEQLCINYVNEKLQQIFIELTLKAEQEEYVREQIKWTPIDFFNNKVVCDLIEEKRPPGIIAALNDACATAHADSGAADNSFVQRLGFLSDNPHFESRGSKFLVRHYAGDVLYNIEGMTDKNKDQLSKDLLELVASSSNGFLAALFPERIDKDSKKRPPTAGDRIKASCNELVGKLMQCHPSYIRTIKPNDNKSSTEYDVKRVLHQVKYLGLCENIRVRRAGFAYRTTFDKFVERFYLLSPQTGYAGDYIWNGGPKEATVAILNDCNIPKDQWQLGVSKVFIKHPETIFSLEHLRDRYWHNMAIRIQRAWRAYQRYRNECATRIQRMWKNNKDQLQYVQLRDYGHQVLAGRKERRRFSLLGMRRFTGDYLSVRYGAGKAKLLRDACKLRSTDEVVFSSKIELLVPRAMRSSRPSPRSLVMTNSSIFIVVSALNNKVLSMNLERTISLNIIKSISLSHLRDDWIVLHIDSPNEIDAVFSCVFKTELTTHLLQRTNGRIGVNIGETIQYTKKPGKTETLKVVRDDKITGDAVYKSHVITVGSGEPANSISKPLPKKMPRAPQATKAKATRSRPAVTRGARPAGVKKTPGAPRPAQAEQYASVPSAASRATSTPAAPPPPPPPARAAAAPPSAPQYKALYPFHTDQEGEISFEKDDIMEIKEKDENGWWLAKKDGLEGWVPSNYLEEIKVAAPPPVPALPPARRAPPPAPSPEGSGSPNRNSAVSNRESISAPKRNSTLGSGVAGQPIGIPGMMNGNVTVGGVPAWKAELEARKAARAEGNAPVAAGRPSSGTTSPKPVVPRKPDIPAKPSMPAKPAGLGGKVSPGNKPVAPPRPGAPKAPPRPNSQVAPSGPASDLAAALMGRRLQYQDDD
ncbi:Myosin-1, partial [Bifiguratus adelaidae]